MRFSPLRSFPRAGSVLAASADCRLRTLAVVAMALLPLMAAPAHAQDSVVGAGQTSQDVVVNGPDTQTVQTGGTSDDTSVYAGGTQVVQPGGTSNDTAVYAGGTQVVTGLHGQSNRTIVYQGGTQTVESGAQAYTTEVKAGGTLDLLSSTGVSSWVINPQIDAGGVMNIEDGGGSFDSEIYGTINVYSGGITDATAIEKTGTMNVYAGAEVAARTVLLGTINIEQSGTAIQSLIMRGGTLQIVAPGSAGDAGFKTTTIGHIEGFGGIALNTDYATGQGDQLTIQSGRGYEKLDIHDESQTQAADVLALPITVESGQIHYSLVGGGTDIGAYVYDLAGSGNNAYLYNSGQLTHTAQAAQGAAQATASAWYGELQPLLGRVGDLHSGGGGSDGAWARVGGDKQRLSPADATGTDLTDVGVEAGYDHRIAVAGGAWYVGVMANSDEINQTFENNVGSGSATSWGLGAYATWLADSGWYGDFVLKYNALNQQIDTSSSSGDAVNASYHTNGYTASAEGGRRFQLPRGWFVEPQLRLTNIYQSGADYQTSYGAAVNVAGGNTTIARTGVTLGDKFDFAGPAGTTTFEPYVNLGFERQFNGSADLTVDGTPLSSSVKGNRGDVTLGLAMQNGKTLQLYSAVSYGEGQDYEAPWSFDVGLRKIW